eukprot:645084-Prymnesium_polylepis.1
MSDAQVHYARPHRGARRPRQPPKPLPRLASKRAHTAHTVGIPALCCQTLPLSALSMLSRGAPLELPPSLPNGKTKQLGDRSRGRRRR